MSYDRTFKQGSKDRLLLQQFEIRFLTERSFNSVQLNRVFSKNILFSIIVRSIISFVQQTKIVFFQNFVQKIVRSIKYDFFFKKK